MARITTLLKNCEYCKEQFETSEPRKRFCNRSCSASWNNIHTPKRQRDPNGRAAQREKAAKLRKSKIQQWLDGDWNGSTKEGLSTTIRKFLLEQAGYKCQDGRSGCNNWSGVNPKSGKTCLTIDHIDGNSQNNTIENLVVMCPNCHSMTPTYGALNKGNGRKHRYVVVTQLVE